MGELHVDSEVLRALAAAGLDLRSPSSCTACIYGGRL